MKKKETLALAVGIGLFPPLWAVLAPYLGIETGAVALICAGVYGANGNNRKDGLRIMLGFWCGDLWALLAVWLMSLGKGNQQLILFLTLAVLGFSAVWIGTLLQKLVFLPAWLCGWAIGLTLMTTEKLASSPTLPLEIGAAMAVGVWYVGAGVDFFTKEVTKHGV